VIECAQCVVRLLGATHVHLSLLKGALNRRRQAPTLSLFFLLFFFCIVFLWKQASRLPKKTRMWNSRGKRDHFWEPRLFLGKGRLFRGNFSTETQPGRHQIPLRYINPLFCSDFLFFQVLFHCQSRQLQESLSLSSKSKGFVISVYFLLFGNNTQSKATDLVSFFSFNVASLHHYQLPTPTSSNHV